VRFLAKVEAAGPEMATLKKNKVTLSKDEREEVKKLKAEWSDKRSAIFKAVIKGKTWYVTHTHRAYQCAPTIKGAAKKFHDFIKETA